MTFGTKAETLERLATVLATAAILPQVRFTVSQWRTRPDEVIDQLQPWLAQPVAVRSSALAEDHRGRSMAGCFTTVLGAEGQIAVTAAIDEVVAAYGGGRSDDQVFVQPMLTDVAMSGVAFTRDANTGAPYVVISYDDRSGRTDTVTSGHANVSGTFYAFECASIDRAGRFAPIVALARELQRVLGINAIDFEFAITRDDRVFLFQVRPLTLGPSPEIATDTISEELARIETKITSGQERHPYLFGSRTVYGVMPDWNPAEIIGIRPKPLALSLYKDVITDSVWAYQRDNYGYRNLRSFPLLVSFAGLPYIDVRVSFNSFLPADLDPEFSERLVNYYIDSLVTSPSHHDKVEFEIVYSCYTLDLPERMVRLRAEGFSDGDCHALAASLRALTNTVIHPDTGLWRRDIEKIALLEKRRQTVHESGLDPLSRIYWLIEDCKRYGTLPFVGLARAAFIAVQLLKSLVSTGVLSESDFHRFMAGLSTVGSGLAADFSALDREAFLARYGHLRPGTYDIESPRYDEAPERYFDWDRRQPRRAAEAPFTLSMHQLNQTGELLRAHHLGHDAIGLFNFIKAAIEGREYAKFIFTRSLSDALQLFRATAPQWGLSADDCPYTDYKVIQELYSSSEDPGLVLARSAAVGRARHDITRQLVLPPLIASPDDVWTFTVPPSEPNYVTSGRAEGAVAFADTPTSRLDGVIMLIPSADPGYDWIFAHPIRGFVTMWGGANSHMAVRAAELNMPAVIGSGETLFAEWARAGALVIDCANRQVTVIK